MYRKKLLIVIFIILVVGIVGYFALIKNGEPIIQQTPTPIRIPIQPPVTQPPISAPINEIEKWKAYRNEKYGFEVKHPENWTLTQGGGYFNFNDSKYLNSYTDAALLSIGFDDINGYFKEVSKESNLLETFSVFGYTYVAKTYFFNDGKKVYAYCMFDRYEPKPTETDFRQVLNVCNKILSTFKFTR